MPKGKDSRVPGAPSRKTGHSGKVKLPDWVGKGVERDALLAQLKALEARFNAVSNRCMDRLSTEALKMHFDYLVRMEVIKAGVNLSPNHVCRLNGQRVAIDLMAAQPPPWLRDFMYACWNFTYRKNAKEGQVQEGLAVLQGLVDVYVREAPRILKRQFGISGSDPFNPTNKGFTVSFGPGGEVRINGVTFFPTKATTKHRLMAAFYRRMEADQREGVKGGTYISARELQGDGQEKADTIWTEVSDLRKKLNEKCTRLLKWNTQEDDIIQQGHGGYRFNPNFVRIPSSGLNSAEDFANPAVDGRPPEAF